jgi:cytochrome b involved in lipid metabolism
MPYPRAYQILGRRQKTSGHGNLGTGPCHVIWSTRRAPTSPDPHISSRPSISPPHRLQTSQKTMSQKFTPSQIATHTTAETGMYLIIDGNVYDVTSLHPHPKQDALNYGN